MKTASITEAKNNLSALIDGLKGGSPVLIMDRGRPVARLEPVGGLSQGDGRERLAQLIRDGLVRPRRCEPDPRLFTEPLPRLPDGVSIVDLVIQERREGW